MSATRRRFLQSSAALAAAGLCAPACAAVSERKAGPKFRLGIVTYNIAAKPVVSITNQQGRIVIKPSSSNQVVATVSHSDKVNVHAEQIADRIELESQALAGAVHDSATADYEVLIPNDAFVILRSSSDSITAQNVEGDLVLEAVASSVDVSGIRKTYIRVKTLGGSIVVADVSYSHLEITTVSGEVTLRDVTRSSVSVHSGSGKIKYEGGPGMGTYTLVSHSGDIEVEIPAGASVEVKANSLKGRVENGFLADTGSQMAQIPEQAKALINTSGAAASLVLHSLRGNIHIKAMSK